MIQKFLNTLIYGVLFFIVFFHSAFAQDMIPFASTPEPVGSGARALGMGGAFIAVADDATAASWNPAGLVQLDRPEMSIVWNGFHRTEDSMSAFSENNEIQRISNQDINYLSMVYPFNLFDRNITLALNYQHLYDFKNEQNFKMSLSDELRDITYEENGSLSAIGVACAIKATPQLYFGVTLNFWNNYFNKWEKSYVSDSLIVWDEANFFVYERWKEEYSFKGVNANIGILWRTPDDKLKIGGVIKLPFTADLKSETKMYQQYEYTGKSIFGYHRNMKIDMPISYGIGFSYRPSDQINLSADIYKTQWQDFIIKDEYGNKISYITGKSSDESDIDPTIQFRMGAEYIFIKSFEKAKFLIIPVRSGIFYSPAPAEERPDDYYGFSLGTGIATNRFSFDVAYQYRWGNNVRSHILPDDMDFSQDISEHNIYSSLTIYF